MSTSVRIDDLNSLVPAHLAGRRRDVHAFIDATRHSRRVGIYRKIIPVITVVSVLGLVVMPLLSPLRALGGLSMGPVKLSGTQVTMDKPKMNGFKKDNSPYEVTATSAVQDIRKPSLIDLIEMKARMQMGSDGWATLESKTANFETQKEQLKLREGVVVKTQSGYDIRMKSADADFKAGTIISTEPVKVTSASMRVEADTLDVTDNGKAIIFKGRVRTTIVGEGGELPPEGGPSARESAAPVPVFPAISSAPASVVQTGVSQPAPAAATPVAITPPAPTIPNPARAAKDPVRIGPNGERL
jgi:lipopolysaccharide export system protein LptC